MTSRTSLYKLIIIAPVAWGGLLLFTRFVPPFSLLAFIVFFLILSVALTSTFSPLAYIIGSRLLSSSRYQITVRSAIRQGALLSLAIILNLVFRALDSWNIFMACVIFAAIVVVEVLSLAKK